MRRNLNHRPIIHLPRINNIIPHRKKHNRPRHQTAKIHLRRIRLHNLREKTKHKHNNPIPHPKPIQQDPPDPRYVEGAPDQFVGVPGGVCHLGWGADCAPDAVPEEEGFGEHVGGVETADADGDYVVEGGGGTDVDEADGAGDAGHDYDGVYGYG